MLLRRQRRPVHELVRPVLGDTDLLVRQVQGGTAAGGLLCGPPSAHLRQQRQRVAHLGRPPLGGGPVRVGDPGARRRRRLRPRLRVEEGLHLPVRQLRPGADAGAFEAGLHDGARGVQQERPHERRALAVRQQGGGVLAQHLRVQGDPAVGQVDGLAAAAGLGVHGAARGHEGGHVRDRVADEDAVVVGGGQEQGLVQVRGAGGVHGDERQGRAVRVVRAPGQARVHLTRGRLRLGQDGGGEGRR